MRTLVLSLVLSLAPFAAYAQTSVFSRAPSLIEGQRNTTALGALADYVVTPNVREIARNAARDTPGPVVFHLPGQAALQFEIRRFEPLAGFNIDESGGVAVDPRATDADLSYNLYGVARGVELTLVVHKGRTTGSVSEALGRTNQAWTLVESKGRTVLRELDLSRFPPHLEDGVKPGRKTAIALAGAQAKRIFDGGANIDVLVLYTDAAAALAGGQPALNDLVRGSLFDMETALSNSQAFRIRMKNVSPNESLRVAYNESPGVSDPTLRFYQHRTWARTNVAATSARNTYSADLVVLMVADAGFCGVAYTQRADCGFDSGEPGCAVGAGYNGFAVSVVSASCALPTRTLAHEVGHQFGMEHDRANGTQFSGDASFPWSYGYAVSTSSIRARDIMAYDTPKSCMFGCPVQLHYSNPNVSFQAFPGTPSGTLQQDGFSRSAFNARTAMILAPGIAAFRGPLPVTTTANIYGHGFEALPDIVCNPAEYPNCPAQ